MSQTKIWKVIGKHAGEASGLDVPKSRQVGKAFVADSDFEAGAKGAQAVAADPLSSDAYKGKVVVDKEEFGKLPKQEQFRLTTPKGARDAAAQVGEEVFIPPHRATDNSDFLDFDPEAYKNIGLREASAQDMFTLGRTELQPQRLTLLPASVEAALSNDDSKLRTLGRFFGIHDKGKKTWLGAGGEYDMDYSNKGVRRTLNTLSGTLGTAAVGELASSWASTDKEGNPNGAVIGKGMTTKAAKTAWDKLSGNESEEDKAIRQQKLKEQIAKDAKENKGAKVVRSLSPAGGKVSRQGLDYNFKKIATQIGDSTPDGEMTERLFSEAIRDKFVKIGDESNEEALSRATRQLVSSRSADEIVQSLLFAADGVESEMYDEKKRKAAAGGQTLPDLKPSASGKVQKFVEKVKADDPSAGGYITFPTSMITTMHEGQKRTGLKVQRQRPDGGEPVTTFVVPVIVPKKTKQEQEAEVKGTKSGTNDVPTLSSRLNQQNFEIMYIDPDAVGDPLIPASEIIF